ncbi:hypothetical protein YQE_09649, partial [Dendroctonus ponderosae]
VIQRNNEIPNFSLKVLRSDESQFTKCGLFNHRKNTVFWSDENPRLVRHVRHQVRFGFKVWLGIVGTHIFFRTNWKIIYMIYPYRFDKIFVSCKMALPLISVFKFGTILMNNFRITG